MGHDYVNAFHGYKDAELGSAKVLPRAISAVSANPTVREVKAVEVSFADQMARAINVNFVNKAIRNNGLNVNTGPIIGIVEWGTGGGDVQRIEFNAPPAYTWRQNGGIGNPVQWQNGVTLTVHASSIRVMGRNDARQLPIWAPNDARIGPDLDGAFSAFISQGNGEKPCAPLQRAFVVVSGNNGALPDGQQVNLGIPRFAKRVRFPRQPIASTMTVAVGGDLNGSAYTENIVAGFQGQIELSPLANTLAITNTSGNPITTLTAVFDLAL